MQLEISQKELARRKREVAKNLKDKEIDLLCLFSPTQIFYLTGLHMIQTERPMAFILEGEKTAIFVPLLEQEHVEEIGGVDEILTYDEYPGKKHPMEILAEEIAARKPTHVGVDNDGYGGGFGYEGPALSELLSIDVEEVPEIIQKMMQVKSKEEINLIRESVRWGNLAHQFLQDYTHPGLTANEISIRASLSASRAMIKALGPGYRPIKGSDLPAGAGFRGQIGKGSAIPHALTTNKVITEGDVLVTGASSEVGGYTSELERTMIVGKPTEKQTKYFQLMIKAQDTAFEAIKPGKQFSTVDKALLQFYRENDLENYWRHHTGHSIGINGHEAPYFDQGDKREIEPGMVVTVEPGIYIPDFAGFRHSDTVLVTEDGFEILTYYPRDLESLIV